jgi:hypothetical protein
MPAGRRRLGAALVLALLLASAGCLAAAPSLMPASYSITEHTISESAAQGVEGAWLARLGFLLFGFAVLISASIAGSRWGLWGGLFHRFFGALIIGAAAFSHQPWTIESYDEIEDVLHSAMASGVGLAFTVGVLVVMLRRGPAARWSRLFDGVAIVAATVIPMVMFNVAGIGGLVQRIMFAVAYLWHGVETVNSVVGRAVGGSGGPQTAAGPRWAPMSPTRRQKQPDTGPTAERSKPERSQPERSQPERSMAERSPGRSPAGEESSETPGRRRPSLRRSPGDRDPSRPTA